MVAASAAPPGEPPDGPTSPPRRLARSSRDALPTVAVDSTLSGVETDVDEKVRQLVDAGELHDAIALLSREYQDAVYTLAIRITRSPADALDVLQNTFEAALKDLVSFKRRASVRVWLLGIAHNRAIDSVRGSRRSEGRRAEETEAEALEEMTMPDAPSALDQRRRSRALEACLRLLPARTLAAVLMRFQHGLTYEEMSENVKGPNGEKPGTLQARVSRAFPVLRRCLKSKGVEL